MTCLNEVQIIWEIGLCVLWEFRTMTEVLELETLENRKVHGTDWKDAQQPYLAY